MTAASAKDLTVGLLGKEVNKSSPNVTWMDGHTTILPTVYDDFKINVCAEVDIPIIKYLAECPVSTPDSNFATHISNQDIPSFELHDIIGSSLSQNRPVTLRGTGLHGNDKKLTLEYLDLHYAISPNRAVWIHDVRARALDHTKVTKAGFLNTFFESMNDPNSIQCVLDIPLAQISLPDSLRNLDHGIAHGANCDAEVITLLPGDMLIMHHGKYMPVYTPVASFATGGHFYTTHACISPNSLDIQCSEDRCSPLCIMVTQGKAYRAKKGHKSAVVDTETAPISLAIAQAISAHLGVTTRQPIPVLLYKGDQFDRASYTYKYTLNPSVLVIIIFVALHTSQFEHGCPIGSYDVCSLNACDTTFVRELTTNEFNAHYRTLTSDQLRKYNVEAKNLVSNDAWNENVNEGQIYQPVMVSTLLCFLNVYFTCFRIGFPVILAAFVYRLYSA
ncbi:hypothetical protein F4604DRAFT_1687565 [Suillus subluteus]|nr:hypothetical protein F4604DRAFT_1687565 [Suillus subluteus]